MTAFRNSTSALAATLLLATPVAATPSSVWDLFSLDRLSTLMVQYSIIAARSVAEVTYADLDVALLEGRIAISGLSVRPYDSPGDGDCVFTVDRAVMTTAPLDQIDYGAATINLLGAEMSNGCLYQHDRRELEMMGIDRLMLDRGEIRFEQVMASGAATLEFQAVSAGMAEIRGSADLSYFAFNILEDPPEPVAYLTHAELELRDLGMWAGIAPMMPGFITDAAILSEMMMEDLIGGSGGAAVPVTPTDPVIPPTETPDENKQAEDRATTAARAFITDLAGAVAGFANSPGRMVITLNPETPVLLEEDLFDDFVTMVAALSPAISSADAPEVTRLTAAEGELIANWTADDTVEIAREDRLRFAQAFLSGIGAPRNIGAAMEILTPLFQANDGAAIDLGLGALDALEPFFAYRLAHHAAAGGNRDAFAQLDGLERALPFTDILTIQFTSSERPDLTGEESASDLRNQGYAALTGLGQPRSYAQAYYYGLLALAAGDLAAESLIDEVEAMAERATGEDSDTWQTMLDTVNDEAMNLFFARGDQ